MKKLALATTLMISHFCYSFSGAGVASCSEYLDDLENDEYKMIENTYVAWSQGFISGLNYFTLKDIDMWWNPNDKEIHYSLKKACSDSPLSSPLKVLLQLHVDNLKKVKNKKP
jgi:hypothetical protein